ncbi:MAG: hypothetical protein ACKVP3_17210 [Hyphomicrobiaceae bacterium]
MRQIGEQLQRAGQETVQTPMPWLFLELLCQLDEKEEARANEANERAREQRRRESAPRVRAEIAS